MNSYMFHYISTSKVFLTGNKERSQNPLILMCFKRKQRNYYVMSLSPVFTENGPYINKHTCINIEKKNDLKKADYCT